MSETKIRCNPLDIVGKVYNGREVIEYIGPREYYKESRGITQKVHMYKIKCTKCGAVTTASRSSLKLYGCKKCCAVGRGKGFTQPRELVEKRIFMRSINPSPNKNNLNGMKYLHSYYSEKRGYYIYSARVSIKGKCRRCYTGKDRAEAEFWCTRMHKEIVENGIDGFIKWFDSGDWKKEK